MIIDPERASESTPYILVAIPDGTVITPLKENLKGMLSLEMAMIHNVFIRGVNSVYNNASTVAPQDIPAFVGYCLVLLEEILDHTEFEETCVFPVLEQKIPEIAENLEEHEEIQDEMGVFRRYMYAVREGRKEYDGEKTRRLCKAFADVMVRHLHDEIKALTPEKLAAFDDEPQLLQDMVKRINEHIKQKAGNTTILSFVTTHHDISKAPNWPLIPSHIKWISRHIAPYTNTNQYWKFSPFKRDGSRQTYTPTSD